MAISLTAVSAPNALSVHRHVHLFQIPASNSLREPFFSKTPVFPTLHTQSRIISPIHRRLSWQIGATSEGKDARIYTKGSLFDGFVSAVEVLFMVPPIVYSIGCLIGTFLPNAVKLLELAPTNVLGSFLRDVAKQLPLARATESLQNVVKQFQFAPVSELFASQCFLLLGSVMIASLIRRRQWKTFYNADYRDSSVDLISRIEKVEDDLKNSARITSELSEHVEALRIPISEMTALAQKNSEATVALTAHKDLLEKELREILQVLFAMQEQQRKQLQLILEVGQASKVIIQKQDPPAEEQSIDDTIAATMDIKEPEIHYEAIFHGDNDGA